MTELLGQHSGTASSWAGLTGKHRMFPNLLLSLHAAFSSLEEKVLHFLLYCTDLFQESKRC